MAKKTPVDNAVDKAPATKRVRAPKAPKVDPARGVLGPVQPSWGTRPVGVVDPEAVRPERDYTLNPEMVIYRAHDGNDYRAETVGILSDGARTIRCITNQPATSGLGDFVAKQGNDPGQWRFA